MSLLYQNIEELYANEEYSAVKYEFNKIDNNKKLPKCLYKELEYAESGIYKSLRDEKLFPIRFLWFFEIHEYKNFQIPVPNRSIYHPKMLYEKWQQCYNDDTYRTEAEEEGVIFDMKNKAISLTRGWVLIGDTFITDLDEILGYYSLSLDVYDL
jgi:hypothetical protein